MDEPEQSGKADPLNPNPTRVSPHKQGNNTNTEDSNDTYQPLIDFNQPSDLWKPQSSDYQNSPSKDKNGNSQVDLMPTRLNSLGIDRYAYTSNCPTKYTDPSGHCDIAKAIAGGAIVGLGLIPFSLGTATMLLGSAEIAGAPLTGPFYFLPVVDGWKGIVGCGIMMAAGGGIIIVGGIFIYQSGCIQEILDDTSD